MKKIIAIVVILGGSALYLFSGASSSTAAPSSNVSAAPIGTSPNTQTTPSAGSSAPPVAAGSAPTGQYKDGTYTGSVANAYWGPVQVQATVHNGAITNVRFLSYPNSHSTSTYINQQIMPVLTQEAIAAQSANVNYISGATFTSQAFQQSLAAAIAKAHG